MSRFTARSKGQSAKLSRRDLIAAALALGCFPDVAMAETADAITPEAWLARWLAAFNDRRPSAYPEFVRAHIPDLVSYLDDDLGLREATGGFVLLRSEVTKPGEITAWARDRSWERFSRIVLSIGNGRIDDLSFVGAPPPDGFAIRRLDERDALARLRHKLRVEAAAARFSGAVLVAKDGEVLFREGFAGRNAGKGAPVAPATRFCVGSMGKMFTAVATLQLVQNGRLALDDPIALVLPDYPNATLARQVTTRHLLTHTGGTGDFFGPEYERHAGELRTPSDFIRRFGTREPAFPPGSRWGYSNFGFILLGAIIERVSGLTWDTCLERNVLQPVGMTSTSPVASAADTAVPLTGAARTGLKPLPFYVGLPAGGGYSTVDDLLRFATALRRGRLLDAKHRDLLTTGVVEAGSARWSLGLRTGVRNGEPYFGHGGSAPGVNGDFAVYPRAGYEVIVLANRGHPHAVNVAEFIGARLPG